MRILFLMLLSGILIGCSSYQSEVAAQAQANDWYTVGILDGENGHYRRVQGELEDLNALGDEGYINYKNGYSEGIAKYCTPENAQRNGKKGIMYKGQCANTEFEDVAVTEWKKAYNQKLMLESIMHH